MAANSDTCCEPWLGAPCTHWWPPPLVPGAAAPAAEHSTHSMTPAANARLPARKRGWAREAQNTMHAPSVVHMLRGARAGRRRFGVRLSIWLREAL